MAPNTVGGGLAVPASSSHNFHGQHLDLAMLLDAPTKPNLRVTCYQSRVKADLRTRPRIELLVCMMEVACLPVSRIQIRGCCEETPAKPSLIDQSKRSLWRVDTPIERFRTEVKQWIVFRSRSGQG
ncbi:hypothetical protein I7I51_06306 [Histoplasma capsulatum]|uniref:Uncharacterized protein n=1 Tax=Ajellomyces capsulatus TaxID=5037 RepID=A0A8A1MLD5_AJECA|nr:hypothetical protein I7I51_06306 [Histoplasma capsulatum]